MLTHVSDGMDGSLLLSGDSVGGLVGPLVVALGADVAGLLQDLCLGVLGDDVADIGVGGGREQHKTEEELLNRPMEMGDLESRKTKK